MWTISLTYKQISKLTSVVIQVIKRLLDNISSILVEQYYAGIPCIGGDNIIVEIDESKIGKHKYKKGHAVDGMWVSVQLKGLFKQIILFQTIYR